MYLCRAVVLLIVTLAVFCLPDGVSAATSLQCYTCNDWSECSGKPKKLACTPDLANAGVEYLDRLYNGVDKTPSQFQDYSCFSDQMVDENFNVEFMGCVPSHVHACALLPPPGPHTYNNFYRQCRQCQRDYCNPAAAVRAHVLLVLVVPVLAALRRYV